MSTNYYLVRKNNTRSRKELASYIENEQYDKAKTLINHMDDGIHLYQRAGGWKISVDYHKGKYFDKTVESFLKFIDDYLKSDDWFIRNEYGVPYYNTDIVIEDIESCKNGLDAETYYKRPEHKSEYYLYKAGPGEETVGDVRFVFYEDFC